MSNPAENRELAARASRQRDQVFAEAVTGWATNRLFFIPGIPDRYSKLPWRRIQKTRGSIRGALFIARILILWPFEMIFTFVRPTAALGGGAVRADARSFSYGDHVCFLYRSDNALQRMLARFVSEGFAMGDQCVCVESNAVQARLRSDLQSIGIDVEKELARGSLVFLSGRETYFENGEFDPQRLLNRLSGLMDQSRQAGFSGLRVAGEIPLALGDPVFEKQLIDYERQSDAYFAERKAIGFCHFRVDSLPHRTMDSVVDAHGLHIMEAHQSA
jgi:MEDS: MEthanogen/methylotroph, DcmR Sensory domain